MPVRGQWNMDGLSDYLEEIARAGQDIDAACEEAVEVSGEIILQSMLEGVPVGKSPEDRHPGQLKSKLEASSPVREGNVVFVDIGLSKTADADTAIYGAVQEYGSSSNQAQPYVRPAFDKNKARVRAAQRKVLQDRGLI